MIRHYQKKLSWKIRVAGFRNHDNNSSSTVAVLASAVVAVAPVAVAVAVGHFWRKSCTIGRFSHRYFPLFEEVW